MNEKVTVLIVATQCVTYNQEIEMTLEEFNRLDQMFEGANGIADKNRVASEIENYLNLNDVFGANDIEIDEFSIVIDASGDANSTESA